MSRGWKKDIISLATFVVVMGCMLLFGSEAYAIEGSAIASGTFEASTGGAIVSWQLIDNCLTISADGDGNIGNFNSANGKTLADWGSHSDNVEKLVIQSGVKVIGSYAFMGMNQIREVELPSTLTELAEYSFRNCSSIKEVNLPASIKDISATRYSGIGHAFYGCTGLEKITVDSGNTSYKAIDGVLLSHDGTSLECYPAGKKDKTYTVPGSVHTISACAFVYSKYLEDVIISKMPTTQNYNYQGIFYFAFQNCDALKNVIFTGDCPPLQGWNGYEMFKNDHMVNVCYPSGNSTWTQTILDGLVEGSKVEIDEASASFNVNLKPIITGGTCGDDVVWYLETNGSCTVTGAGDMLEIYNYPSEDPFYTYASRIKQVQIDEGVTYIPSTFNDAANLTKVALPNGITVGGAFSDCPKLTDFTVPEDACLQYNSFRNIGITSLDIPASTQVYSAFQGCKNLTEINVAPDHPNYTVKDNVLYNKDMTVLLLCPGGYSGDFVVPDSIDYIEDGAFVNCNKLTSITFPDKPITFGQFVFEFDETSPIKSLVFPNNVGYLGWIYADNLNTVIFEGDAPYDNSYIFSQSSRLDIYYPANNETWTEDIRQQMSWQEGCTKPTWHECTDLNGCGITLAEEEYTYDGSPKTPKVHIQYGNTVLAEGADYTVTYENNVNAGTGVVSIKGHAPFSGTVEKKFKINPAQAKPVMTLSAKAYVYSDKVQKPKVTVQVDGAKLTSKEYKVTWPSGCKNVGTYKVIVTLTGNYTGSTSASYVINPKGTTVKKLTAKSKAIKVNWKKQSAKMSTARITGYQIQIALNSKFTSGKKTVKVKGYTKTSKTIKNLKAKKKYYIRVRTYKTSGSNTWYSSWSVAKSIKTKQ